MKKRKQGVTGNEVKPRWELDYDLLENEGLFGEYLEMGKSYHYGQKKHSDWLLFQHRSKSSKENYSYPVEIFPRHI